MRLRQRLAEEPLSRSGVAPDGEQEVDGLAEAIDRAIQVGPDTFDLDVRLVHPPGTGAWAQVLSHSSFQCRGVGLDPTEQRRVIHPDATVRQHRREVTVADRERQIPSQRPENDLRREVPPFEPAVPPHRYHPSAAAHRLLPHCGAFWRIATEPQNVRAARRSAQLSSMTCSGDLFS